MTDRRALVLPGAGYTPARPLLHFTRAVLESHGWTVVEASWPPGDPATYDTDDMVTGVATRLVDEAGDRRLLIVGKSLGSLAMPLAAARGISGIWITPLLRRPTVAQALDQLPAPTLLIGSTADETWDGDAARRSGHDVLELTDANHALELGGDPLGSIDALREVIAAVDRFVAGIDAAGP
jgi:hypothetical protein